MKIQNNNTTIEISFDEMKFLGVDYVRHLISEITVTKPIDIQKENSFDEIKFMGIDYIRSLISEIIATKPIDTQKENSVKVEPEIKTQDKKYNKKPIVESENESYCNSDSESDVGEDDKKINKCVKNVFEEKNNVSRAHLENPFKKK